MRPHIDLGPMSSRTPTAIDLFAGCGGVTQGLKKAGFRVLAAIELDDLAARTYRLNHPSVTIIKRDIRRISARQLLDTLALSPGQLDLIAACPPCQGFSSLTTRNGAKRNRNRDNHLVLEICRFVNVLRPRFLILENVPGLLRSSHMRRLRKRLRRCGYASTARVLNVASFGVPQRRRRLVLLAKQGSAPTLVSPKRKPRTVHDAIGHLCSPGRSRDSMHNYRVSLSKKVRTIIRLTPKNGGSRCDVPAKFRLDCHRDKIGYSDVYGRMYWSAPSPTITSGCINPSKGRFIHPSQNRPITLREAALLQSFPRHYRFDASRGRYAIALMIGNAMPPDFIQCHAMAIRRELYEGR